jgi:hypothetical protein
MKITDEDLLTSFFSDDDFSIISQGYGTEPESNIQL